MDTATAYNGPAGRGGPLSRSITERVRKAAAAAAFGAWECSLRVNGRIDSNDLTNSIMLVFVAPWMFIGMGIFLPDGSWGNRAFCIAIGMLFLCVGIVLFRSAWQWRQAGEALIHLFDSGAVLERTKGHLFMLPYADTSVDSVLWQESIEGGERPCQHCGSRFRMTEP